MEPGLLHRKEALILTSIEIVHELGFQGLTTKEIAKRAKISESTIFKHFKNKNDLIVAVLGHFSQYDEAIVKSAESKDLTPREKIIYFIDSYVTYYENYPEITAILHASDSLINQPEFQEIVRKVFDSRWVFVKELLDQLKSTGMVQSYINTENLTDVITGTVTQINLKWRLTNFSFSLKEQTLTTLNLILDAFLKQA